MQKFGTSQPVRRLEDARFLTGAGRYIDDVMPEGALQCYVFRSPVAHATITALDVTEARAAPGVAGVFTASDLAAAGLTNGMDFSVIKNRDGSTAAAPARPILAEDRVRFVGEPIAFVVADTLMQAKDAAELIEFDFEELPVKLDLAEGGEELHAEAPGNLVFDWDKGDKAAVDAAMEGSAHRVRLEISDNRVFAVSMEPRGGFAVMEEGRLHLGYSGQGVWGLKSELAKWLGLGADDVRVTTPDVGGGFGMKAMIMFSG